VSWAYNRDVTKLLEKAFEAAKDLPTAEQDQLAARILDEVAWETSLASGAGREKLRQMVDRARADIRAGRVREFRPEDL
jgi:hypothetical protein